MNRHFVILSMVALAGCSSQPGPLTPTEFCNKEAREICAAVSPACLIPVTGCTPGLLAKCSADAQTQANSGLDFIPPNAEACLTKVNATYGKLNQGAVALAASDFQAMNEVCNNVYRGTTLANGPCSSDAVCLNGLICDKLHCGTALMVAQGAGCANTGETCPQGFYCGDSAGVLLCVTKAGPGGTCTDVPCSENLRCSGGVCATQLGIGEDCAVDQDCSSGFCEPYAAKCAQDVRFANGSAACIAMSGP